MHALEFKKNLCKEQVIALEPYGKHSIFLVKIQVPAHINERKKNMYTNFLSEVSHISILKSGPEL